MRSRKSNSIKPIPDNTGFSSSSPSSASVSFSRSSSSTPRRIAPLLQTSKRAQSLTKEQKPNSQVHSAQRGHLSTSSPQFRQQNLQFSSSPSLPRFNQTKLEEQELAALEREESVQNNHEQTFVYTNEELNTYTAEEEDAENLENESKFVKEAKENVDKEEEEEEEEEVVLEDAWIEIDFRYGETCRLFKALASWTWHQTASYIQTHYLNGGLLIASDLQPAGYTLVRPERNGEKWTAHSMAMTLAEASSMHQDGISGPYQLNMYKADALVILVHNETTEKVHEFSFPKMQVGHNPEEFLAKISCKMNQELEAIRLCLLSNSLLTEEGNCSSSRKSCFNSCSRFGLSSLRSWCSRKPTPSQLAQQKSSFCGLNCKHMMYTIDPHNRVLLERFMQVGHEDAYRYPCIHVQAKYQCVLINSSLRRFLYKGIAVCALLTSVALALESYYPDLLTQCSDYFYEWKQQLFPSSFIIE